MGSLINGRSARAAMAVAAVLCMCAGTSACTGGGKPMSADKAFALSASALSGMDSFGFDGQLSIVDPAGTVAAHSRYRGEVTGHGDLKLQWTGGQMLGSAAAPEVPAAYNPLQILKAIQNDGANVACEGLPTDDGTVRLKVTLPDETARRRVAEQLRSELAQIKAGLNGRRLSAAKRKEAGQIVDEAGGQLEAALSTLRARTFCLWTADRKTWLPSRMTEETELVYAWKGRPCRERRVSVTDFLPGGSSGTMGKSLQD